MNVFKQVIANLSETLNIKSIGSHIKGYLVFFENLRLSKTRALQRIITLVGISQVYECRNVCF